MTKVVRIVQCLCGPLRHAIMAIAYEPGLTTAQKELGGTEDITLTEENAAGYLRSIVESMIRMRGVKETCAICGAASGEWIYDDQRSRFRTLAEALPVLREIEEAQRLTREFIDGLKRAGRN